jgi:hypothetical protein
MYQVSRAIYRELACDIIGGHHAHEAVLRVCERNVERMVTDRQYFARPARTLFHDLRPWFDMPSWPRVWRIVEEYVTTIGAALDRMPRTGLDVNGDPLQCRATTRRGTPCQRMPLEHNGYCPSHQHLAETEELEQAAMAA